MHAHGVVLASGGLDSLYCLHWAIQQCDRITMLYVDYGQPTATKEKESVNSWLKYYHLKHSMISLIQIKAPNLYTHCNTSEQAEMRQVNYLMRVPQRNLQLLLLAAVFAERKLPAIIVHGAQPGDIKNYPDCQQEFFNDAERTLQYECSQVQIRLPAWYRSKASGLKLLLDWEPSAPIGSTWSCTQAINKPCGKCEACEERATVFAELDIKDPILH